MRKKYIWFQAYFLVGVWFRASRYRRSRFGYAVVGAIPEYAVVEIVFDENIEITSGIERVGRCLELV